MLNFLGNIFKPRNRKSQTIEKTELNNSTALQIGGDNNAPIVINNVLQNEFNLAKNDVLHLNNLLKEQLIKSKEHLLSNNVAEAFEIISTIIDYGLTNMNDENKKQLYYLKSLVHLIQDDARKINISIANLGDENDNTVIICALAKKDFSNISALNSVDSLLATASIIYLYTIEEYGLISDNLIASEETYHTFDYLLSLSLFNTGKIKDAIQPLSLAISKHDKDEYLFFKNLFSIDLFLRDEKNILIDNKEPLKTAYDNMLLYGEKCSKLQNNNIGIYTQAKLSALLIFDKNKFLIEYNTLDEDMQSSTKDKLALYYFLTEDYKKSAKSSFEFFSMFPSKEALFSLFSAYLSDYDYHSIINMKTELDKYFYFPSMGTYLCALNISKNPLFNDEFDLYFAKYAVDLSSLIHFLEGAQSNSLLDKRIYEVVLSQKDNIDVLPTLDKVILSFLIAEHGNTELSLQILSSTNNLVDFHLEEAFASLSRLSDSDTREFLADWFITNKFATPQILSVRAECYLEKEKYTSSIQDFKQAFKLDSRRELAVKVVLIDAHIPNTSFASVEFYIEQIKNPLTPDEMLFIAQSYIKHSIYEKGESLLYQSIYSLNNEDNNRIYEMFLQLSLNMMVSHKTEVVDFDIFQEDTVVTLKVNNENQEKYIDVCHNSEVTFNQNNSTIGALHLSKENPLYLSLLNKRISDIFISQKTQYEVVSILCKHAHTFRYVYAHFDNDKKSDEFYFEAITASNFEEMMHKVCELLPTSEDSEKRIDFYMNSEIKLPIESIAPNQYDKYLIVIKMLLYSDNTLLFSGIDKLVASSKVFVLTLPSLVISKILNFDLTQFKESDLELIVPESLLQLVKVLLIDSNRNLEMSPGSLHLHPGGQPVLIPPDKQIPAFWNSIYEQIYELKTIQVTNEERIEFNKNIKEATQIDLEYFFSMTSIDSSQLDSLIIAQAQESNLVTDDIFFRNIASMIGIENTNHTYFYQFSEKRGELLLALSKTNYMYVPVYPFVKSDVVTDMLIGRLKYDVWQEILNNLITDSRKIQYYFSFLPDEMKNKLINMKKNKIVE